MPPLTPLTLASIWFGVCLLYQFGKHWRVLGHGNLKATLFLLGVGLLLGVPVIRHALQPSQEGPLGFGLWVTVLGIALTVSYAYCISRTVGSHHFQEGFGFALLATTLTNRTVTLQEPLRQFLAATTAEPALPFLGVLGAGFVVGVWTGSLAELMARFAHRGDSASASDPMLRLIALAAGMVPIVVLEPAVGPSWQTFIGAVMCSVVTTGLAARLLERHAGLWVLASMVSLGSAGCALAFLGRKVDGWTRNTATHQEACRTFLGSCCLLSFRRP